MKSCALLVLAVLVVFAVVAVKLGAQAADGGLPVYAVGDYWKFSYDAKEAVGLFGSLAITVTADAQVIQQFGVAYTCYELDVAGSGAIYGAPEGHGVTGNWTLAGKLYLATSDLSEVKSSLTTNATLATAEASVLMATTTETTYGPPLTSLKFPLTCGASCSAETNETSTTTATVGGATTTETNATLYMVHYEVVRPEVITIPAGEFATHLVRYSTPNGSSGEYYFAPDARYSIIENTYSTTGALTMASELMEYGRATRALVIPPLILVPAVTAGGVVVGFAAYSFYSRKRVRRR
jgi:hypothetical protein